MGNNTNMYRIAFIGLLLFALCGSFIGILTAGRASGVAVPGVTQRIRTEDSEFQNYYTFFTATTTTATSTNAASSNDPGFVHLAGASDAIFYFSRGDTKGTGNSGSSLFKVQVTPDGSNWFDYNELGQVTVSTTDNQFYTRQGTTTISAATSTQMWAMEDIAYYGARCVTVRATDGEASCAVTVDYHN